MKGASRLGISVKSGQIAQLKRWFFRISMVARVAYTLRGRDRMPPTVSTRNVVEVRMRNEDVVNLRELRERQVADPGAGVDQDVAIEEKRRCAQVAPSDPPRAAEHAQTHAPNPSTFRRIPSRRSIAAAAGAGASPRPGRGAAPAPKGAARHPKADKT